MILQVQDLSFHYHRGREIFTNVSFTLSKGEIICILGNNGAGKSTLLNCVANLYKPTAGKILLNGQDMSRMAMRDVARVIGYVPQINNPTIAYSVLEFVVMGRTPYIGTFSRPGKEDYRIAMDAMERLQIDHLKDKLYTELSGGERQQVCIARAIAQQPQIILLDEPTAHLDYGNQYKAVATVKKLAEEGYAIMMTTHTPDHAIILGDKVAVLDREGSLKVGQASEMMNGQVLSALYGMQIKTIYNEEVGRNICIVL